MANGFNNQLYLALVSCAQLFCNSGCACFQRWVPHFKNEGLSLFGSRGQISTSQNQADIFTGCRLPSLNTWFILCISTFHHVVLTLRVAPQQCSETFIKPNSWEGKENCTFLFYIIACEDLHWSDKSSAQLCKVCFSPLINRISAHFLGHLLLG